MTKLPGVVQRAIDAINSGDVDAFVTTFVPSAGTVNDWGRELVGASAIRAWGTQEIIGRQVTLEVITSYATDVGDCVVLAQIGGNCYNGPATLTFRTADDLLISMLINS